MIAKQKWILFGAFLAGVTLAQFAVGQTTCPTCGRQIAQAPSPQPPATASDGLDLLNQQRAERGLGPLVADPTMMAGAMEKAKRAASRRIKGHLGGSLQQYGANKEGVGWTNGPRKFNACYAYSAPAGTRAGGACVRGSDGWYSCLLIDHAGYLPSGRTGGVLRAPGRVLRAPRRLFRRRR